MEMQLDPKAEPKPLNITGDFLSQCSTSFQEFSPYNATKCDESPDCCSVTQVNSESLNSEMLTSIQQTTQVDTELVMTFFQEDLDTSPSPVLALSHSTFWTANCIIFKLILTNIPLRLF